MHSGARHLFLALLLLAVAVTSQAGEFFDQKPLAQGFVSSVDPFWHLVKINGGQIVIDASEAEIRGPAPGDISSFDAIRPGVQIAVVFQRGKYLNHQPLPATIIQVLRQQVGTITGEVESVDVSAGTFKILGQTIHTTETTTYGGSLASLDPKTLAELPVGRSVTVFLDGDINSLTARSVYVIAPLADDHIAATGTLRKIDGDTWYLLHSTIDSFKVIRTTSIDGRPRVGDLISVFGRVDNGEVTAEAVELARVQCPGFNPNPIFNVSGNVVELTATSLTFDNGTAVLRAELNEDTLYDAGDVKVGDNVDVRIEKIGDRSIAKMVTKVDSTAMFTFIGVVKTIAGDTWTIESSTTNTPTGEAFVRTRILRVTTETQITGSPQAGDRVIVLSKRAPNGDLTAVSIAKDPRA